MSTDLSRKSSPSVQLSEEKMRAFLHEARQAVVLAGGVNANSLVKIRAIAAKHHLSDAELDAAMKQLHTAALATTPEMERFRDQVEKWLKKKGILTPLLRLQLLELAKKEKLTPEDADRVIRRTAEQLDIAVVSEEEAIEHMTRHIQQMNENGILTQQKLPDVYKEAAQWGLTKPQVNAIIRGIKEDEHSIPQPESKPRKRSSLLLGTVIAAGIVLLVGGGLTAGYFLFAKKDDPNGNGPVAGATQSAPTKKDPTKPPVKPPQVKPSSTWPSKAMAAVFEKANAVLAREPELKILLASDKLSDRFRAYQKLIPPPVAMVQKPEEAVLLRAVLVQAFVDEQLVGARAMQRQLLRLLLDDHQVPANPVAYEEAFAAIPVMIAALKHPDLDTKRAEELLTGIEETLGAKPDAKLKAADLQEWAGKQLSRRLFQALIKDKTAQAIGRAAGAHDALVAKTKTYFSKEQQARLSTDFLVEALGNGTAGTLSHYVPLLDKTVESGDSLRIERLLSLHKSTANVALQQFLRGYLVSKLELNVVPTASTEEINKKVQEKLAGITKDPRLYRLQTLSKGALSRLGASPNRRARALQETIDLTHASTLACALANQPAGLATFDSVVEEIPKLGPKAVMPPGGVMPGPGAMPGAGMVGAMPGAGVAGRVPGVGLVGGAPGAGMVGAMPRPGAIGGAPGVRPVPPGGRPGMAPPAPGGGAFGAVGGVFGVAGGVPGAPGGGFPANPAQMEFALKNLSNRSSVIRVNGFRQIATMMRGGIENEQAEKVAFYLMTRSFSSKANSEHNQLRTALAGLKPPRNFLLALADAVTRAQSGQSAVEILSNILGRDIRVPRGSSWKQVCRKAVLKHVLDQIDSSSEAADEASELMAKLYKEQGILMGMRAEDFFLASQPSQTLEQLIKYQIGRLEKKTSGADRDAITRMRYEIDAAELVGDSDLRRTVLYQRLWLRILEKQITLQKAEVAEQAKKLREELDKEDLHSSHILAQLRSGEEKIHRMWMLLHPKN